MCWAWNRIRRNSPFGYIIDMVRLARLFVVSIVLGLCAGAAPPSEPAKHPARTSRYNVGNAPGRFRGADKRIKYFELKAEAPLFDGSGREMARVKKPVM